MGILGWRSFCLLPFLRHTSVLPCHHLPCLFAGGDAGDMMVFLPACLLPAACFSTFYLLPDMIVSFKTYHLPFPKGSCQTVLDNSEHFWRRAEHACILFLFFLPCSSTTMHPGGREADCFVSCHHYLPSLCFHFGEEELSSFAIDFTHRHTHPKAGRGHTPAWVMHACRHAFSACTCLPVFTTCHLPPATSGVEAHLPPGWNCTEGFNPCHATRTPPHCLPWVPAAWVLGVSPGNSAACTFLHQISQSWETGLPATLPV